MNIGEIVPYVSTTAPEGFLVCDGSAVSRDQYSGLFDVIGTTFGSGDGSTTFNLPDLSGKVIIGSSLDYLFASTGGEESHTLLATEMASHVHEVPTHTHGNTIAAKTPAFSHTITQPVATYNQLNSSGNMSGSNQPVTGVYTSRTSAAMTRGTNLSITAHAAAACTMSGGVTDCDAFDTESTGVDAAHDNMMPYLSLTYLIRCAPDVPPAPKMYFFNGILPVGPNGGYICGKG